MFDKGCIKLHSGDEAGNVIELQPPSAFKLVATVIRIGSGSWTIARGSQLENAFCDNENFESPMPRIVSHCQLDASLGSYYQSFLEVNLA